jgi:hypothetical protein
VARQHYGRLLGLAVEGITSFSVVPLRLALVTGFVAGAAALALTVFYGAKALLFGDAVAGAAGAARADSITLRAVADTTIYAEQSGSTAYDATSDGAGPNLWTSVLAAGVTRRALVRFDLSAVPKGSRIIGAQLQLFEIRARDEHVVSTHRLLASYRDASSYRTQLLFVSCEDYFPLGELREVLRALQPVLNFVLEDGGDRARTEPLAR